MTKTKRIEEIAQLLFDIDAHFQARFAAEPELTELRYYNQQLCDVLNAAFVRVIFSDNQVSRYLTDAGQFKEAGQWVFRRKQLGI